MKFADFSSPAFYENPYPFYETIRKAGVVVPVAPNAVVTARYGVIDALLRDRRVGKTYLQSVRARYGDDAVGHPVFQALNRTFLMMNPPSHTRLRGLMTKAFTARQIESLREIVEATVLDLIKSLQTKAEFDLIGEFAMPLPVHIICRLLDIPFEHGREYAEVAGRLVAAFDLAPLGESALAQANDAALTLERYFGEVVEARRANPGSDIISVLLRVEDEGVTLTDEEIVSNVILMFIAGHETTSNLIGNTMVALFRHPERLAELRADRSLLGSAVAECLRYDTSVQVAARTTFEAVEVDGATIPAGTVVFMLLGGANRDPGVFAHPDTLDFRREGAQPSLSFGAGVHFCLGARLATLEIETAVGALLDAFPAMEPIELDTLAWLQRNSLRGVSALRVRQGAQVHAHNG